MASLIGTGIALAGCTRERPAGNQVDLDAAAAAAQGDIANYAAGRHAPGRRAPARPIEGGGVR